MVVSSPVLQSSPLVPVDVAVIGGIPQKVLKIKLEDRPDKDLKDLEPNQLIDRILIGPCEHSAVIEQHFGRHLMTLESETREAKSSIQVTKAAGDKK